MTKRQHGTETSPQLKSMWAVVQGRKMHARVSIHASSGPQRVVLVHGLGVSSRYMLPTALRLTPFCSVYAVDLPGFGKSEHPRHALNVPQMARALNTWMEAAKLESAHFIGNSMGCQVIIDLAMRYPERIERAILIGPTFDRAARRSIWSLMRRVVLDGRWEPRALSPIIIYDYLSAGLIRVAKTLRYGLLDPIEAKLPLVNAPMLVVRGEHDSVVPTPWASYVARLLPASRMVIIRGASHAVNFSDPDKLLAVALPFLSLEQN